MAAEKIREILERYLPPGTAGTITDYIVDLRIHLHIKRDRKSKAGDYRAPTQEDPRHRISINHNLNRYAFLITMVHELAHRRAYQVYDRPHGEEWKRAFREMMRPFLSERVFPPTLLRILNDYLKDPAASSSSDEALARELNKYDPKKNGEVLLEELAPGAYFTLGDDRIFKKGALQRTRFLCACVTNRKKYLVTGVAPVIPVDKP